ncbi:hypothetical protein [Faecalibacter rhinopitheci]|uniref:Uncharacterized protein n=1 Tax=Faecalibacter rhinopitheci TaxID=2779678 RepID=A0A8J7FSA5_9FLAO|nr:hypothetical protein [Faecalibacter rhinopitheci]MBF0597838.1 hypothetical protein [Faecalibacter rhinopitheci]
MIIYKSYGNTINKTPLSQSYTYEPTSPVSTLIAVPLSHTLSSSKDNSYLFAL